MNTLKLLALSTFILFCVPHAAFSASKTESAARQQMTVPTLPSTYQWTITVFYDEDFVVNSEVPFSKFRELGDQYASSMTRNDLKVQILIVPVYNGVPDRRLSKSFTVIGSKGVQAFAAGVQERDLVPTTRPCH